MRRMSIVTNDLAVGASSPLSLMGEDEAASLGHGNGLRDPLPAGTIASEVGHHVASFLIVSR
jgi:hypothetical protein